MTARQKCRYFIRLQYSLAGLLFVVFTASALMAWLASNEIRVREDARQLRDSGWLLIESDQAYQFSPLEAAAGRDEWRLGPLVPIGDRTLRNSTPRILFPRFAAAHLDISQSRENSWDFPINVTPEVADRSIALKGMSRLARLPYLKTVSIVSNQSLGTHLWECDKWRSVRCMYLDVPELTSKTLQHIAQMRSLEVLCIVRCNHVSAVDLEVLADARVLKTIYIVDCQQFDNSAVSLLKHKGINVIIHP